MEVAVIMPKLGLIMTEGIVVEWHKSAGDTVDAGEVLVTIESDKVTYEVESPASGVLGIRVTAGDGPVPIGATIGTVATGESAAPAGARPRTPELPPQESQVPLITRSGPRKEAESPSGKRATPIARRIAKEHHIDVSRVEGSGDRGAITEKDVRDFVRRLETVGSGPVHSEGNLLELTAARRVAAERLTESFRSTPHFYLGLEVEATGLMMFRDGMVMASEDASTAGASITDALLWFVGQCLKKHPEVNASWDAGRVRLHPHPCIALAVAVEQGLVAPVFREEHLRSPADIIRRRIDIVERARNARLLPDDLSGGTFTLTNLGMHGIDTFHPIINPPQCAILAVGRIKESVVVRSGDVVVRPTMHLTLAADHRVLDGVIGASFLRELGDMIAMPMGSHGGADD